MSRQTDQIVTGVLLGCILLGGLWLHRKISVKLRQGTLTKRTLRHSLYLLILLGLLLFPPDRGFNFDFVFANLHRLSFTNLLYEFMIFGVIVALVEKLSGPEVNQKDSPK